MHDEEVEEVSASPQSDTSLIFTEIRAVGACLDGIEGQLGKIAASVTVLENSFASLTA